MKSVKLIAFLTVILLVVVLSLPIFVKSIPVQYEIDIYSPLSKTYEAIADSYSDIFMASEIEMISEWDREIIDSTYNNLLSTRIDNGELEIYTTIEFIDRNKMTRLKINEKVSFHSWINHSFGVIFSSSIQSKREKFYVRVKQGIESTPDPTITPEELK